MYWDCGEVLETVVLSVDQLILGVERDMFTFAVVGADLIDTIEFV